METSRQECLMEKEMREACLIPGLFQKAFAGMLVCLLAEVVAYYCLQVLGYTVQLSSTGTVSFQAVVLVSLLHVSCVAIAVCIVRMLADAASTRRLSAQEQSRMLVEVSALLAICALIEIALVLAMGFGPMSEPVAALDAQSQLVDLSVAFSLAIFAIVNFCLSHIVEKYSFLQWFYGETV